MKGVERTNVVIIHLNQRVRFAQHNPYAIEVNRRNKNCYNCRRFGHLVRNYRNRRTRNRIGKKRRLEYRQRLVMEENNRQCNLNGEEDVVVLD